MVSVGSGQTRGLYLLDERMLLTSKASRVHRRHRGAAFEDSYAPYARPLPASAFANMLRTVTVRWFRRLWRQWLSGQALTAQFSNFPDYRLLLRHLDQRTILGDPPSELPRCMWGSLVGNHRLQARRLQRPKPAEGDGATRVCRWQLSPQRAEEVWHRIRDHRFHAHGRGARGPLFPGKRITRFSDQTPSPRTAEGMVCRLFAGGRLCGRPPRVKDVFGFELSCRLQVCVRPIRAANGRWP
jgi:hypothetical protein